MGGQESAGPGVGEDRSKQVIELRERILQLAGHDCNEEEEKTRIKLLHDLSMCKRDTLIELCHSFDITGSKANRKEELVSFLMKFLKNNCSRTDATIPVEVSDLRKQILQLAEHACHEQEEKLRSELLERLNVCKRDTLIELCHSFDLIGSRANRKEELVSFLMQFVKEHSSPINPDKKIKKRRRPKEENLPSGKPLKKKKQEGAALEAQNEEEANVGESVEHRRNYSEGVGKDNRFLCADSNGKFPIDKANLEPTVVTTAEFDGTEFDGTNMKASNRKNSSITKKKATPKNDHKAKSCGKKGSKGDTNPRKLVMKPSRDELREAVVFILDSTDFATMTFGDVVKEVDKYFGKDLFERKPLIRSLIEEELFRLSEEAEKKELEEEEAAEAKARAEQSTRDCRNGNGKDVRYGASVKINSSDAAEGSQNGKANADTKIGDNKPTNDGSCEKVSPSINNVVDILCSRNGKVATVNVKNNNVDALEGSNVGITKEACNGEDDTEYNGIEGGKSLNGSNNSDNVNVGEAGESRGRADDERTEHAVDGKAEEASKANISNIAIHGDGDGKIKEGNIDPGHSLTDSVCGGKAEDANHNVNTKVDVDSGKNGDAENGQTGDDVKADSNGIAKGSQM